MFTNNKLAKSVRLAIMFGAAATALPATQAFAAEEEEADVVERIEVTGSRIKRTDMEGALPVTVIDRAQIELSGESSVADLLRNTTFNSTGSFRPQSGSSAQGVSQINLRGIGADRTLVLIDGRRLPKSPSTGSTQDLSTIPMAAVERVEILTDGASAVYGSDAIGGVVNIITRKDFNGLEIKIGAASIEFEGGDREEGSIVFGSSSDTTQVIGGVSWNSRDIVFARDFPWYNEGGSVFSNNFSDAGFGDTGWGAWTAFPGGCDEDNFYFIDNPKAFPDSDGNTRRCAFNFASVSADEASTGNVSLFANARHQVNDDWEVYTNASISKSSSFGRYAPVPDGYLISSEANTTINADSPNNPTNPESAMYDPAFGENRPVVWYHRFAALGNRDNNVDTEVLDLDFGASGEVMPGVYLDFGGRRTMAKTYDIGRNYLVRSTASNYINDGTYDLQNPSQNPPEVLNAMKATISRISEFNQDEIFGSVSFDMFEFGAGTVQAVVGFEYREETYLDQYDSLSEAGQIGGSSGNSAGGSRDVTSYYFESLVPLMDELELTVAGRYDSYNDAGSDFSPKVSLRYTPSDEWTLRASYGQGFRAPGLDILTQKDSFSADSVQGDAATCAAQGEDPDCSVQISGLRTANPNLESEKSQQMAAGVVYAPLEWFNITLDYYNIEIEERINFFDAGELVAKEQAGDPIPSGLGVERAANGAITRIVQGYGNEGTLHNSGIDVNARFSFDDVMGGALRSNVQLSYITKYTIDDGRDLSGDPGVPPMRITINNAYNYDDFEFAWNISRIDSQAESVTDGVREGTIEAWTTHDMQVTYSTAWDGKLSVGMQNVTGELPPLNSGTSRDYDFNLYNGYGKVTYFRYTQSF